MTTPTAFVRYYDVISADGTKLRAWTNDAEGPVVLVSNGLGTNPHAWPSLLKPDCGVRVISWNHRGTGGSARPVDNRVDLDAFIEDAVAVMDHAGVTTATVVSWSAGVTVAFELAGRFPERVNGILAVAGVPGNTFATMLAPIKVPPFVAKRLMVGLARSGGWSGPVIAPITKRIPWTNATANMLRWSRLINPAADVGELRTLLQEFCTTHPSWYAKLAIGVSEHQRVSLSSIAVPVTFLSGKWDMLTGARDMLSASKRVEGSRYRELASTHFIPVEFPEIVMEELKLLRERVND